MFSGQKTLGFEDIALRIGYIEANDPFRPLYIIHCKSEVGETWLVQEVSTGLDSDLY